MLFEGLALVDHEISQPPKPRHMMTREVGYGGEDAKIGEIKVLTKKQYAKRKKRFYHKLPQMSIICTTSHYYAFIDLI